MSDDRAWDSKTFRSLGHAIVDRLTEHLSRSAAGTDPVVRWQPAQENARRFALAANGGADPLELADRILSASVQQSHPRYVGYQVSAPLPVAALFDLVGAVVNAVDDWLSGPQQVAHGFDVDNVKPLRALLSLCHEAGRTVLIVSDHGHTIDESQSFAEKSEHSRWRHPGESPLVEGELLFSGPRVWSPPGAGGVVLPYLSGATYKWKKVGHHGGATLEEVVVPAVFIEPNGGPFPVPHWWQLEAGVSAPVAVATAAPLGETLFAKPVPSGGLSARLVESAAWKERKALLPGRFQEDKLYALLDAMERRPRLSGVEFTEVTGEQERRMAGFASQAGLALNAGGAEVLVFDREARRLVLDVELLGQVFEVDRG